MNNSPTTLSQPSEPCCWLMRVPSDPKNHSNSYLITESLAFKIVSSLSPSSAPMHIEYTRAAPLLTI